MENQLNTQQTDQLTNQLHNQIAITADQRDPQPAPAADITDVAADVTDVAADVTDVAADVTDVPKDISDVTEDVSDVASHVQIEVILDEIASLSEPDVLVGDDADKPIVDRISDASPDERDHQTDVRRADRETDRDSDRNSDRPEVSDRVQLADTASDQPRIQLADTASDQPRISDAASATNRNDDRAPIQLADRVTDRPQPAHTDRPHEVDPLEGGRMSRGIRSYLEDPSAREGVKEISLVMNDGSVKEFSRSGGTAWDNSIFNRAKDLATDQPASLVDVARKHGDVEQDDHSGRRNHAIDARDDRLEDRVEELLTAIEDLVDVLADAIGTLALVDPVPGDSALQLTDAITGVVGDVSPVSDVAGTAPVSNDLLGDAIVLIASDSAGTDPLPGTGPVTGGAPSDLEPVPVTDITLVSLSDIFSDFVGSGSSIDPVLDAPALTGSAIDGASVSSSAFDSVTDLLAEATMANDASAISLAPVQEPLALIV